MSFQLDPIEARVLGALIEKDMATPDYYPMSLNALTNACNQKNNRDPVMALEQTQVEDALERLRARRLALKITGADNRVPKHAHRIAETLNLGNRELAVLCVLLLRGPQTPGELRSRTQSLHPFEDLESVETTLRRLMEFQPEPLAKRLPAAGGRREPRYAHLLSGDAGWDEPAAGARPAAGGDRLSRLEAEVERLKDELAALRAEFADFRRQFE